MQNVPTQQKPEWVRAPSRGQEYFSGFGRSKLYQLANEGEIRSVSIRGEGKEKGTRLFHLQSILDFIERHAAK
jgi:hypothetical protein